MPLDSSKSQSLGTYSPYSSSESSRIYSRYNSPEDLTVGRRSSDGDGYTIKRKTRSTLRTQSLCSVSPTSILNHRSLEQLENPLSVRFKDSVPGLSLTEVKEFNIHESPDHCSKDSSNFFFRFCDDEEELDDCDQEEDENSSSGEFNFKKRYGDDFKIQSKDLALNLDDSLKFNNSLNKLTKSASDTSLQKYKTSENSKRSSFDVKSTTDASLSYMNLFYLQRSIQLFFSCMPIDESSNLKLSSFTFYPHHQRLTQ
eukprot:Awhi_evm1s11501